MLLLALFVISSVSSLSLSSNNTHKLHHIISGVENKFHRSLQSEVENHINSITEEIEADDKPIVIRTATGGFINTVMIILTIFAFLGNGAFLVYVFWLSK